MKSKSLEMILDNMYFIASVDEKEEKVFVALDFEEAGRRYAELKSEGDAIIWHLKKKKLGSRDSACEILCDFGTPIEMVSEERLLRLMSLVVVEGEDSPLESPIIMSEEISDPIQKMVEDIHKILPDDAEVEMVERDLHEGINDIVSDPWFLGIKKKIITKSILLAYKENIEISNAYLLVKLRFQFFSISMKRIIDEFRNFMKNSEGIEDWSKGSRERLAVSAVITSFKRNVHKTQDRQMAEEQKTPPEKVLETTKTEKDPDQIETSPGEPDQRSTPRDLVDGWKERQEDMVSTPKVESSDEVKKPKPIPSSRVLLRGFLSYCKKRGSSKERIQRRILHVKTFLKFIKTNGRSILEIDEEGVKEFESFLRDVRGFKRGTGGEYSGTVRIFYDYTNSEGITNIDIRRSIRAWSVTRMMEIVGKPLTGVYDDETNTIYEEVNQRILEGIEKLGNKVKRMDLTRFVLNIPKSDKLSSGNKAFIGTHLHYLVEHNILEKSSVDKYDVFSKSISEPTFHKVGETMGVVSSEELMVGFSQWLKKKGFKKIHRNEYNYVSITRDFIEHINDIGKTILDDDREHMFDSYKLHLRERNLKESTIGTYIRGICVFYNYMDENPPEELSDQNKSTEREIQPFFNDFVQWLERNHYKKISRTVGIVRNFKDYIESGEKTILDDDRGRMIDLYRLYLQNNKCKKSTIKTYVGTIHLFYRFVDGDLTDTDLKPDILKGRGKRKEMDDVSQYPKSVEGWVKRAIKGDRLTVVCKIDISGKLSKPWLISIYEELNQSILRKIEEMGGRVKRMDLMRSTLGIFKPNPVPGTPIVILRVHLKYLLEHGFLKRPKKGIYVLPSDGEGRGQQKQQRTEKDWLREILGDELQKVDIKDPKDADGKRKNERSLYTGINQRILLELEDKTSMSRSELIKSMFGLKGIAPTSVSNIMDAHLRYLVDQGSISKPQWGIYTLVDDDKKVVTEKTSLLTTNDEKTSHRELSAEDWIRRITNGEKPYAWISYGSMDDTRVVQRGQGAPIYPEMNRRIMVEVRASKDPVKRNELIRPVFDLGWDERISQTVNTILNNHLRYLLYRNVLKQPAKGYYESVPDDPPDYRMDPIFERKIHEGVMDRMTKK